MKLPRGKGLRWPFRWGFLLAIGLGLAGSNPLALAEVDSPAGSSREPETKLELAQAQEEKIPVLPEVVVPGEPILVPPTFFPPGVPPTGFPPPTGPRPIESADTPVGPYGQPEWTTRRRFATTRAYVLPPGQIELEQWWIPKYPREGKPDHRFLSEISFGLPYRFQVDLYERVEDNADEPFRHAANQVEVRWALADWGVIPLNPTLYVEWIATDEAPDKMEYKILLADVLAPGWHYASNLIYEQETSGVRETEYAFSQGLSYTLIERKLALGVEMQLEAKTEKGSRDDPEWEFIIGPSIQWRPTERTHLDVVPLFGTTDDSPRVEMFVIFGIDLGPPARATEGVEAPAVTRGR